MKGMSGVGGEARVMNGEAKSVKIVGDESGSRLLTVETEGEGFD
jgi:hypothetical protein